MKKRGLVINYGILIAAITGVLILSFGIWAVHNAIQSSKNTLCIKDLNSFKNGVEDAVDDVYASTGTSKTEARKMCGANKIYFIDLEETEQNKEALSRSLYEYPVIMDKLETKDNVFLVDDDGVLESFHVDGISLKQPYFLCSDISKQGAISILFDGEKGSAWPRNQNCSYDCSFDIVKLDEDTSLDIINELPSDWLNDGAVSEGDKRQILKDTNAAVKIARRCNCGRNKGETEVEVRITPLERIEDFTLIESIAKGEDTVEELCDDVDHICDGTKTKYSTEQGDYDGFNIDPDPEMMFSFESISEETIITYVINKNIPEYCGEYIKTVALAVVKDSLSEDDAINLLGSDVTPPPTSCTDYGTDNMACNNDANCKWCPKCDGSLWSGNADDKCVDIGTCSYQTGTDNDLDGYNVECDLDCDDDISDDPTGCQGITSCSTLTFECAMCINLGAQEYWGNGDNIDNDCDGYVIPSDYSTQFTAQADVDDLYLLIKDEIGGDCPSCVFDDDALRLTQIQNFASGIPSTQVSEIISDLITAVQNDPDLSTKPDKQAFLEDALNYLAGRITYYGG